MLHHAKGEKGVNSLAVYFTGNLVPTLLHPKIQLLQEVSEQLTLKPG